MQQIKVKKLAHFDSSLGLPKYESKEAAGADIRACFDHKDSVFIEPGQRVLIPTGLSMEIPKGYEIQVRPRSGLSLKTDLLVVNAPGTIDSDYRGEVKIIMGNFGKDKISINHGDRVAQLVLAPITQGDFISSELLSTTERNDNGFGSTGIS